MSQLLSMMHISCICVLVPPRVYDYKNVTKPETQDVTLICLSEGDPSPTITFKKVGHDEEWGEGDHVRCMNKRIHVFRV